MTMNSWGSTELSAWAPPLRMFIMGTGRIVADVSVEYFERYLYSGWPEAAAAARAAAMETARMALAPKLDLLGVPSAFLLRRPRAPRPWKQRGWRWHRNWICSACHRLPSCADRARADRWRRDQ